MATGLSSGASLLEALDAAFVRSVESGDYFTTMDSVDINLLPSDCYAFVEEYEYPEVQTAMLPPTCAPIEDATFTDFCNTSCFDGAGQIAPYCLFPNDAVEYYHKCECTVLNAPTDLLGEVLERGVVRIALPIGVSAFASITPAPIPPIGPAPTLFESLVARISEHYATPLSIEYVKFFGNDATFSAVNTGAADLVAPFAAIGGLVNVGSGEIRRRTNFGSSCGIFASELKLVVRSDSGLTSLQQVRADGGKLCAFVQFTGIATALFSNTDLQRTFTPEAAAAACLAQLDSEDSVAYLTDELPADLDTTLYTVVSTRLTPATAFWSRF